MNASRKVAAALSLLGVALGAPAAAQEPLLALVQEDGTEVPLVQSAPLDDESVRLLVWERGASERLEWLALPANENDPIPLALPSGAAFDGGTVRLVRTGTTLAMGPHDLFLQRTSGQGPLALHIVTDEGEEHVVLSTADQPVAFPAAPGGGAGDGGGGGPGGGGDEDDDGDGGGGGAGGDGAAGASSPAAALIALDRLADGAGLADPSQPLPRELRALFGDVETLNPILDRALKGGSERWNLLDALELDLGAVSEDGETSLALQYELKEDLDVWDEHDGSRLTGTSFRLSSRGTVAFENGVNPEDFLDSRLSLYYFRSSGGVAGERSEAEAQRFNQLATSAASFGSTEEFLASDAWRDGQALVRDRYTTQVYWELGLDAAVESDQRFTSANYAFGAHAALDVKGWGSGSTIAKWNLPDYAFAVARRLSGYDADAVPLGSTFPTFLVGLDGVDPSDNESRSAIDADTFLRARAEVAMKTPVARSEEAEYFAVLSWRYYHELDAPAAIRDVDLDRFSYFSASIESSKGLFVSYGEGKLPLDVTGGSSVQIGWKVDF